MSGSASPVRLAPAKVNLCLHVVGRRDDGYHLLESLVCFVGLGDWLEVEPGPGLSLHIDGPFAGSLGAGEDNLVLRAAARLQAAIGAGTAGRSPGAAIRLDKRLPVASGVGGGSSDAAAALKLLQGLWRARIDPEALESLALALGADVPVCLRAPAPMWMAGVGERLTEAPSLPPFWLTLANPGVGVPTGQVFSGLSRRDNPPPIAPPDRFASVDALVNWLAGTRNDLGAPAEAVAPLISETLRAIEGAPGCRLARMSGSGATCFGVFERREQAVEASATLRRAAPQWWVAAAPVLGGAADLATLKGPSSAV